MQTQESQIMKLKHAGKGKGRAKVYETGISFRCHMDDWLLVKTIALYERLDLPELMRLWLNEKRNKFRLDRGFRAWLKRRRSDPDLRGIDLERILDRKSTRLNSSHIQKSRMPSSA